MILRPRQLFEKFLVEEVQARADQSGRVVKCFAPSGELFGCISTVTPNEAEKLSGLKHKVTHQIVVRFGRSDVKSGDKLIRGDKVYLVETVDDISRLGQFTIIYVTERGDLT